MSAETVPGGRVTRDIDAVKRSPAAGRDRGDPRQRWLARTHLCALVELFVLCGFTIAQPLLDVTGKSPDFFLFRRAGRFDVLLLVVVVTLLPAFCIWAFEVLVGLVSESARRLLHLAAVTGLLTLLALEVAKRLTDLRGPRLVGVAVAGGTLGGVLYARQAWVRLWLRYLAPAPLIFALLFLLVSPTSKLVLPSTADATSGQAQAIATGKQPPLVMILFDEFPLSSLLDSKGQIDRRVYPNIAELADQSTWYRNATGVSGYTPWALPAMLTGNYPTKAKAPSYTAYPDNMLTLFGRYYDLKVFETISQLCPPSRCPPFVGHLDQIGLAAVLRGSARIFKEMVSPYDYAVDQGFFVDKADQREVSAQQAREAAKATQFRFNQLQLNQPSRFNHFLADLKARDHPTFHFLHLLLPHQPWRYLPSGNEYNSKTVDDLTRATKEKNEQPPEPLAELAHQRHLLQLAYTDGLVGQVIHRLKVEGMWDKSLVVMGADHGMGWTPGEHQRILGQDNAPNLMWVPQFIKAPGQDHGVVDDRNWEQVDLLPTVADLANLRVPWKMDGSSQTGRPTRTRTDKWWYDVPGHGKVRDGPSSWKVVLAGVTDTLVRGREGMRGLYRFGAFADLIYRDPASVGPIGGSPTAAVLDDGRWYRTIEPGSGKIPALVSGRLAALPPAGASVLVAVNGRIGGGSRLFPEHPGEPADRFAAIVPDSLWKAGDGHHQLQLYLLDRSGGEPRLRPVGVSGD
jgi:Sulfatase